MCSNQQLRVDKRAQAPIGATGQDSIDGTAQRRNERQMTRPHGTREGADAECIDRQCRKARRQIPREFGDTFLPLPERLGRFAEGASPLRRPTFVPVPNDRIVREMNHHRRFDGSR